MLIKEARAGFTVVELVIVVVIIGILAAITIVAYTNQRERAHDAKITADLDQLTKAVVSARINKKTVLGDVTGSWYTASSCLQKPTGTDFATLPKTDSCWVDYYSALEAISNASGIDVNGMTDPWGRPYAIDENEGRNTSEYCTKDTIRSFRYPHVYNEPNTELVQRPENYLDSCL